MAERLTGGFYLDVRVDREAAARLGLRVRDVNEAVESAVGGVNVSETVEGRQRFPINVRYARDFREDVDALRSVLVATPLGAQVPLGQVASVEFAMGPPFVRSEAGRLLGIVAVDVGERPIVDYVEEAKRVVAERVTLPPGARLEWAGQFQHYERARARLVLVLPLTLLLVALLLYWNTGSLVETGIVLLAVPFSLIGAVWLLWALDYNLSVAVWVGVIALAGLDAQTGVVMLLYLTLAHRKRERAGPHAHAGRPRGGHRRGRGAPHPPEADDGGGDDRGPAAAALEQRPRRRRDEAHRGADGGRARQLVRARAARLPGAVRDLEAAADLVRRARGYFTSSAGGEDFIENETRTSSVPFISTNGSFAASASVAPSPPLRLRLELDLGRIDCDLEQRDQVALGAEHQDVLADVEQQHLELIFERHRVGRQDRLALRVDGEGAFDHEGLHAVVGGDPELAGPEAEAPVGPEVHGEIHGPRAAAAAHELPLEDRGAAPAGAGGCDGVGSQGGGREEQGAYETGESPGVRHALTLPIFCETASRGSR